MQDAASHHITAGLSPLLSIRQAFDPHIRGLLWQTVGFAGLGTIAVYFILRTALAQLVGYTNPFLVGIALDIVSGFLAVLSFVYILAPVSALIASIHQDKIAGWIESECYGPHAVGASPPFSQTLGLTIKFAAIVICANILLLIISPVPVLNVVAFFCVNGYLLGREYFEFAAMRLVSHNEARALHRANGFYVFCGGATIAALLLVPLVNLVTPVYATILMTHLAKKIVPGQGQT